MKHKKLFPAVCALAMLTGISTVNAQIRDTSVSIQKQNRNAMMIRVSAPPSQVDKTWQQQFTQSGIKGTKSGDYSNYKNVSNPLWGTDSLNLYSRVVKDGPNGSIIYLSAANPKGEFITNESDSGMYNNLQTYLYDFVKNNNLKSLDYDIYQVADSVKMDEQSQTKYESEKARIESEISKLNDQMKQMESDYNNNKQGADIRKQRLDELKSGHTSANKTSSNMQSKKPTNESGNKPKTDSTRTTSTSKPKP